MKKYPESYDWRFGIYNRHSDWLHLRYFPGYYRVSHIKLGRVAASMGLNYDLGDKSENFRRMNHFEKFNKANRNFFCRKC